jgi:nitrite reductase (NADH) large subunit
MPKTMRNVIIGNSAAALSATEAIRRGDPTCEILLISGEKGPAYSLVFLPNFISGKIPLSDLYITDEQYYSRLRVETFFHRKAVEILPAKHEVLLEDGNKLEYHNLLICTGASPYPVSIKGSELVPIKSLRTLIDAIEIRRLLESHRKILVIGAGLINLKILSFLKDKGFEFTIVETKDRVLPNMVDKIGASIIEARIEKAGIRLIKGCFVSEIRNGKDGKSHAILSDRQEIEIDMIISNTGVIPNVDWIRSSEIKTNRGILIDEHAQTNITNIYAAGDVAESRERISGRYANIGNWFNAVEQGRIAALSILGKSHEYEGCLNINIVELFGITIGSLGDFDGSTKGSETIIHKDLVRKAYRSITVKEGVIIGAIIVNETRNGGILRSVLGRQIDQSMLSKLIDITSNESFGHLVHNYKMRGRSQQCLA